MTGEVFDLEAVRQWEGFTLPTDRDKWPALMAQLLSDLDGCVERIDELEAMLTEAGAS